MKNNRINKIVCIMVLLIFLLQTKVTGETPEKETPVNSILLTGASFASHENGWFELACRTLHAEAINRAVGGESITNTANKMAEGILYSPDELERIDALVIMHVHNVDVFNESQILPDYTAYPLPFKDRDQYAAAYDYVIKKYISDCYELRNNPQSGYYNKEGGKPAVIILCTDWHDARQTYNNSIRKLAGKWGLPLVEFDKNIGFSKNSLHPVTGKQMSLLYAQDEQTIDGQSYGWHPKRGEQEYIQQRMAAIFVVLMKSIIYPFSGAAYNSEYLILNK